MNHPDISNRFHLSEDVKATLSKHYLLKWRGDYLEEQLEVSSHITHQGIEYLALPLNGPLDISPTEQYKLSFRAPINGSPVVLIKKVWSNEL